MGINVELLRRINQTPGAPGFEKEIRALILKEIKELVDEIKIDNMGNIYAIRRGKESKKVMIGAHMDEIGFIVTHIDNKGFVRFAPLGGFDPKTLTAQRVIIHGKKDIIGVMGCKPIHVMTLEERNKNVKLSDFYIDLGIHDVDQIKKLISIGNPITRERSLIEMGECINSKSLDNRLAVFILIETLKNLKGKELPYDVYGVFTVQEEIGIRGANVAALAIKPDFGFGLDITIACDLPGAKPEEYVTELGKGTAIKVMDSSTVCDYRMVRFMEETAKKNNINYQKEILTAGGTDTSGIQRMTPGGSIAGAISVPTRHAHQVVEMANKNDIKDSIALLTKCLETINSINIDF